jgi:hypothetical protein
MQAIMKSTMALEELTTTMTITETKLLTSRIVNNKMLRLNVELDGTMLDMLTKCERVSKLSNDIYLELSRISLGTN